MAVIVEPWARGVGTPAAAGTPGAAGIAPAVAPADATRAGTAPPMPDPSLVEGIVCRYPPDVPFGLGTSLFRIESALRGLGAPFERIHSGWRARDGARCWERLAAHLGTGGRAIVCVDTGRLGGTPWAAHWAVAWRLDEHGLHLHNWSARPVPVAAFRTAWTCRHLPWPHHHAALLAPGPAT